MSDGSQSTFPSLSRSEDSNLIKPSSGKIRFRYLLAILCMTGMVCVACTKTAYNFVTSDAVPVLTGTTNEQESFMETSFFCGNALLGLPGGRLAEIYSAKWIIVFGNVIVLILHLMTPYTFTLQSPYVLIGSRFLMGLAAGITYPAMIVLMARWSPPAERFILCGIVFGGNFLGMSVGVFLVSWISSSMAWQNSFYVTGAALSLWLIFHSVYVQDYPQLRKGLQPDELEYITSSLRDVLYDKKEVRKSRIPWKGILKSPAFHALLAVHVCVQLVLGLTLYRINTDAMHFAWMREMDIMSRAVLISSSFAWASIVAFLIGLVFSTLNQRKAISRPAAIRFVVTVGLLTPVVGLMLDYYAASDWELVAKPMIIVMLAGLSNMVQSNHIEISPNYAGTLMGITSSISSIPNMIMRHIVPEHDHKEGKASSLIIVYGVTTAICLMSLLVFVLFLSADVQPWNWNLMDIRELPIKPAKDTKNKTKKSKDKKTTKDEASSSKDRASSSKDKASSPRSSQDSAKSKKSRRSTESREDGTTWWGAVMIWLGLRKK